MARGCASAMARAAASMRRRAGRGDVGQRRALDRQALTNDIARRIQLSRFRHPAELIILPGHLPGKSTPSTEDGFC